MLVRYERRNVDAPWLTHQMNEIPSTWLKPTDRGVEFGSGRSTAWLATNVAHVNTIEHNADWMNRVQTRVSQKGLSERVTLHLAPITDADLEDPAQSRYVRLGRNITPGTLDFALVDGAFRDYCALVALQLLKPGGVLIIDNIERYLPREASHRAPRARSPRDGCQSAVWQEVETALQSWRHIWTSNGITETALWLKPC